MFTVFLRQGGFPGAALWYIYSFRVFNVIELPVLPQASIFTIQALADYPSPEKEFGGPIYCCLPTEGNSSLSLSKVKPTCFRYSSLAIPFPGAVVL